jgi:hypothetical protein
LRRDEVSGMQHEVGTHDQPRALVGQRASRGEMGIGDGEAGRSCDRLGPTTLSS